MAVDFPMTRPFTHTGVPSSAGACELGWSPVRGPTAKMLDLTMHNPSAPPQSVVPVLAYPGVRAAVEWLSHVFGFVERVQIGDHRAQLSIGNGAVVVADASYGRRSPAADDAITHSVMMRVEDVDAHYRATVTASAPSDERARRPTVWRAAFLVGPQFNVDQKVSAALSQHTGASHRSQHSEVTRASATR
jgi:uncharacterized glyoxalase superfamily protein PhnB